MTPLRIQVRIGSQGSKFFRKLRGGKIYCTEMLTYSWFPLVRKVKCPAFLTDKNSECAAVCIMLLCAKNERERAGERRNKIDI